MVPNSGEIPVNVSNSSKCKWMVTESRLVFGGGGGVTKRKTVGWPACSLSWSGRRLYPGPNWPELHTLMCSLHADQTSVKLLKGNRAAWVDRELRGAWRAMAGGQAPHLGKPTLMAESQSCTWAGWDLAWLYLPVLWGKEGASFLVKALPGPPDHLCHLGSLRCKDGPRVLTQGNCQHPNPALSQPGAVAATSILEGLHTPRQSPRTGFLQVIEPGGNTAGARPPLCLPDLQVGKDAPKGHALNTSSVHGPRTRQPWGATPKGSWEPESSDHGRYREAGGGSMSAAAGKTHMPPSLGEDRTKRGSAGHQSLTVYKQAPLTTPGREEVNIPFEYIWFTTIRQTTQLKNDKDPNKHSSKDTQIANKHMKRCSTSRIVRNSSQNHNEISLHSYYDGKSEKDNRKSWWGCGETGNYIHSW